MLTPEEFRPIGTREVVSQGVAALEALPVFLETLGEDAELAEFRAYENTPIEAIVFDGEVFLVVVWNGARWGGKER